MRGTEEGHQVMSVERMGSIGAQGGLRLAFALSYRVMLKRCRFLLFFKNTCSATFICFFPQIFYIYIYIYLTNIFLDSKIVK